MSTLQRCIVASAWAGTLVLAAATAIHSNSYGLTLFLALPCALGALGAWVMRPDSAWKAITAGAAANAIGSLGFFALGYEGFVCVLMAMPLVLPLGALGGWLAYAATHKGKMTEGAAALLLLPLGLGTTGFDLTAKPRLFVVRSSIEIAAPPETVWMNVVSFSELPPPTEWYFKTGLAYPMRAHIDGSGPGATRYCEFSTGPFVEPIEVWDEPRLLRFSVAQNPAPMEEWSPYAKVVPPHLHGKLISKQGQFLLTPLPNGHTVLEGTTWYQHGLWPEAYWTIWSQAIIHRIHMRVLVHIKNLSEGKAEASNRSGDGISRGAEPQLVAGLR
jgi:hypothetical protein